MADIRQASFSGRKHDRGDRQHRGTTQRSAGVAHGSRWPDDHRGTAGHNFRRPSWAPNGRDVWVVDGKNKVSIVTWQDGENRW